MPVTHTDLPVPIISITASGPQAPGDCPQDTSVKQESIMFSEETEVHSDERLPFPKAHRGLGVVLSWRRIIRAATIKMSGQDFSLGEIKGRLKDLCPSCLSTSATVSVPF